MRLVSPRYVQAIHLVEKVPSHMVNVIVCMSLVLTFVHLFKLLPLKVLHGAVQAARDTKQPLLLEKERKSIFVNMSAIHSLNSDLLMELEDRLENW